MREPDITYLGESSAAVIGCIPEGATRLLDVGCGRGGNAHLLKARGIRVDGITLSQSEADAARQHCDTVYVQDLEMGLPPLPDGRLYDAVICSHVLEHLVRPDKVLTDIHGRLHPSGRLIVALPNLLHWKSRLRLQFGRFDYTESGLMDRTHVRWYSFASARRLLEQQRFTVTAAFVQGGLPLGPLRRVLPRCLTEPLDRAACRLAPGLLGHEMIYVARADRRP